MKKKYLSMKTVKIPMMVALVIAMTLPMFGSAWADSGVTTAVVNQAVVYTDAEVADFLNNTNEISISFPTGVSTATIAATSQAATTSAKDQLKAGMEQLIPRNTLWYNPAMKSTADEPIYGLMAMNQSVRNAIAANPQAFKDLAAGVFYDMKGNEWYGHLVALGVYGGMLNGYPDGEFKGDRAVSIAEYSVMFAASIFESTVRSQALTNILEESKAATAAGAKNGGDKFYYGWAHPDYHWWVGSFYRVEMAMPNIGDFGYTQNSNLSTVYPGSNMTRGDVAYSIAKYYFATELENRIVQIGGDMLGNGKGSLPSVKFTDANTINPKTTRQAIVAERMKLEDNPTTYKFSVFELYRDCVAHPENGIPVEWYAAISLLAEKGIMNGYPDGSCGWTNTVTRGETLQFLYNVGEYKAANLK